MPPVGWEPVQGGGDRIKHVWTQLIRDRRVVCAIVDTDHSMPSENEPVKVRLLQKAAAVEQWPLAVVTAARCREADNLIPFPVLQQLSSVKLHLPVLSHMDRIAAQEKQPGCDVRESFLLFVDLKEGISWNKLDAGRPEVKAWYEGKLKLVGLDSSTGDWPGFGTSLITQVLEEPRFHGEVYAGIRTDWYAEVFDSAFEAVLWCCAARSATRA